ncbi:MAG: hypothetical protein IJ449_12070 [Clostridia bacterium]|nr:hypothetical protein [Clostridia bacterium]
MMKRNLALLLAAVLASSMLSCGGNDSTADDTTATGTTAAVTDTTAVDTEAVVEATTPATILLAAFKDYTAANPDATAEEIATALSQNEIIPFGPMVQPMVEGYHPGFTTDITGFTESVGFMPMIGTIPFVAYVFTVDEASIDAFKETLTTNYDLRWNICTEAEEMVCESVGDKVFFVMARNSFEEEVVEDELG